MRRTRLISALACAAAALALAPAAHAQSQNNPLLNDIQQNGIVDNPCQYSPEQLRQGIQNLPPDAQQYADTNVPDCNRPPAAAQQQTQVDVNGNPLPGAAGSGGGGPTSGDTAATELQVAEPPAPRTAPIGGFARAASPAIAAHPTGPDAPWWLPALGLIALVAIFGFLLSRRRGWSGERYTRPARAAVADAGGRTADGAAEIWDWMRLGR